MFYLDLKEGIANSISDSLGSIILKLKQLSHLVASSWVMEETLGCKIFGINPWFVKKNCTTFIFYSPLRTFMLLFLRAISFPKYKIACHFLKNSQFLKKGVTNDDAFLNLKFKHAERRKR